ncbi:MAG: RNA-binding protein [Steroidobacteraceae bacterium]
MPKGPRGEKRPADVIARAVMVAKIATGEIEEAATASHKNPAAVALGRKGGLKGGKARAEKLSAKKLSDIAKAAAKARWSK